MTVKAQALSALALVATMVGVQGQTVQTAPITAPPMTLSDTEQAIQDIKNPFPWLSWGGDLRIRNEYFDNALSLTTAGQPGPPPYQPGASPLFGYLHAQDYFRIRGRVWTAIKPTDDITFNVRLTAEPREFMEHSTMDTYYNGLGLQWRYGIIDSLNVQWRKAFDLPVTVTVGRQDIFLGDGWLVGDGTPEDGSFTTFLDSARITVNLEDQKTTIDAIGLIQDGRPDGWLPTLGPSTSMGGDPEPYLLTDQNEKGAIIWIANKSIPEANLDGFFIYKNDTRIDSSPEATFGDNADIFTFGGSVSGLLQEHVKYMAEGAYQFGRKQDPELNGQGPMAGANPLLAPSAQTTDYRGLNAFGVNARLSYLFNDKWNDQLSLCFEFLSGDNPGTGADEMFDLLWGRWPRWSEMYNIYSYVQETRVGQTANLYRIGPQWTVSPYKNLDFSAAYYAMFANQSVPTRDLNETLWPAVAGSPAAATPGPFTTTGIFRGHYFQTILKYRFSKHMTGHLWGEWLLPGDYYVSKGLIQFLRAEVMFIF